jgi:hypothetical protein
LKSIDSNESPLKLNSTLYELNLNKSSDKISLIFDESLGNYVEENIRKSNEKNDLQKKTIMAIAQLVEKNNEKIINDLAIDYKTTKEKNVTPQNKPKQIIHEKNDKLIKAIKPFKKLNSKISKSKEKIKFHKIDIFTNLRGENNNHNEFKNMVKRDKKEENLIGEFLKKKNQKKIKINEDDNIFMFYNNLSLIMLSMLGGGVVGVIFILYFSFKNDNPNNYN